MTKTHLIFLHGWGGSKDSLRNLSDELKSDFEILLLELPGHGETEQMKSPWAMDDFAEWLGKEVKRRKITNYILIGHSFGGKTILQAVSTKKLNPEKIILINSNGVEPKNSAKRLFWRTVSKAVSPIKDFAILKGIKYLIYKLIIRETDYVKTSAMLTESFKLFNEQHLGEDALSNIKTPTLIIWGEDDKSTPLWMGKFLHKNIQNSDLVVLDGTHGLPLHSPKEVASVILNWIEN